MRFEEKLRKQMLLKGLNQQKLAKASQVSDSEISRILTGKSSNPGLENALKIARAVGLSLDYLADDSWDEDRANVPQNEAREHTYHEDPAPVALSTESEIVEIARELGTRQARRILETACDLGYEMAIRRLLDVPIIQPDPHRAQQTAAMVSSVTVERRA